MKTPLYSFIRTLLAALFCFVSTAGWGQTTFFTENMGTATATTAISANTFQNGTPVTFSGTADVRGTSQSDYAGASKGANVMVNDANETFIISGINTSAYENITLTLGQRKGASAANNELKIEVSGDGSIWTPLTYTRPTGNGTAIWAVISPTGTIPTTETLSIKFTGTNATEWRIDDVKLSGILIPTSTITFANLQFPGSHTMNQGSTFDVYGQVYAEGLTEAAGAGSGITAQVGYSTTNTNPETWTNWISSAFNVQVGNNDEFKTTWGNNLTPGTYYYATRFRIGTGAWVYGGYNTNVPTAGGIWNGTANVSGVLTVNSNKVTWGNFQHPANGTVVLGGNYDVYGQVYDPEITPATGEGSGISAEVGFSLSNTNPNSPTGWTWNSASYNTDSGNNDEYKYNIGSKFTSGGTHYMAFRYRKSGSTEYVYGGTGGIWNNDNATVDVTVPVNITSTLTKSTIYGVEDSYTITATGSTPLTYAATGLPAGLTIDATGVISGTVTGNVGTYNVTISATNGGGTDTETLVWTITQRALTITGLTGVNKVYDATTSATLSGTPLLNTIVTGDDVSIAGTPTAVFADKNVGTGKAITFTGYTLTGTKSGNYILTQPSLTANITAKNLTVTGAVAQNKPYDGTTAATITGATLLGVISSDAVTVSGGGTFAQSNVGTGISVTANLSLGGTDAGNYSITQPTGLSADITAVSPTISANVITINVGGTYALPGANISSNSTGAFSYILGTPVPAGSITLTGGTTLNGIAEGSATLTVNQAANGNYTAGTATVTVNVISCTPPVWEENFDYGCVDGTIPALTTNWVIQGTLKNDLKYNAAGGLALLGYPSSGIGGSIELRTADDDIKRQFASTSVTSGSVYASFLINMSGSTSTIDDYFISFMDSSSSYLGRVMIQKKNANQYSLGVSKQMTTSDSQSTLLNFGDTYLIVIKYEIQNLAGNTDPFKLWIFSNNIPASEASAGNPISASSSGTDASNLKYFSIRQTNKAQGLIDGIRIATTWEQLFCGTPPDTSPKTYTWNGSASSSWDVNCNWSPKGVPGSGDSVILDTPGTSKLVINSSKSVKDFTLNGTGDFSMGAAGVLTITGNVTYGGSATAALDCASTVKITSASSQPVPPLSYGNLDVKGGDRVFSPTGEIGICGAFNVDPNNFTYTVTNSTVNYKSPDPNWVMTPFTYHHLKFTGTGDFSIGYSDPEVDKTINVQGDFTQTAGILYLGETTSKTATLNIDGNMTLTGGTLQMNYVNGGKGVVNLKGNFTGSATAVMEAANTGADFNFTGSGSQANPQQISYANQGSAAKINFNVNSGAYVKLINQDLALGSSSSFNVKNGGILDFGFSPSNQSLNITNHANSAKFQTEANSTIKITSPEGITNTTGTGNVRTMTTGRVFDKGAIYHYVGKVNQATGNGIPDQITGKLIVELETQNATQDDLEFRSTGTTTFGTTGGVNGILEIRKGKVFDEPSKGFRNYSGTVDENNDGEADVQKGDLVMTGGKYVVSGGGFKPSLSGNYTLNSGTVEFAGNNNTKIRVKPAYFNVDVSGSNVTSGGKNLVVNNELKVISATAVLTIPEVPDNENPYVVTAKKGIQIAEGGQAIFKNNANLMQEKDAVNTGNITMERKATVPSVQYNYWSSPVKDQPLYSLYPGIPDNKVMVYNSANDRFTVLPTSSNPKSVFAKGYSIKGSSNTDYAPALTATFVGEPHNETTAVTNSILLSTAGSNYNLIGNPYPSNLNLLELFEDEDNKGKFYNVTSGPDIETPTAYFWDNTSNTDLTQQGSGYVNMNYALLNLSTGIGTSAPRLGTTGKKPNGIVKPGQGFIMRAAESGGSLTIKNTHRTTLTKPLGGTDGVYYKANEATTDNFWLTLTTPNQMNIVIALAYHPEAENSFERFDSMIFSEAVTENFYSVSSDGRKLAIQSRKGDFNTEDKIPLGIKSSETGLQKISLESNYGAFENQPIYLKDKVLNTVVNLSETPYEFTSVEEVDQNRFEIVYKPATVLATDNGIKEKLTVYRNANDFIVKSKHSRIDEVEVYDVSGRLIIKVIGGSDELRIDASSYISGTYVLKIKCDEKTVTKKILK